MYGHQTAVATTAEAHTPDLTLLATIAAAIIAVTAWRVLRNRRRTEPDGEPTPRTVSDR